MTNEALIDSRIERTVKYLDGSDTSLKYACITAAQVVGTYSGTTEEIAKRTRRSVSSVQNWAHAFRLYKELRRNGNFMRVRKLWRVLPASHWWLAYDIHQSGYDAYKYIDNAECHNWSGRDMLAEWKRDREAGTAPLQVKRAKLSFYGLALELSKVNNLTAKQQNAVKIVIESFEAQDD